MHDCCNETLSTPAENENNEYSENEGNHKKIKIEYVTANQNHRVQQKKNIGVVKKAMELGTLTDCEIAIMRNVAARSLKRRNKEKFYHLSTKNWRSINVDWFSTLTDLTSRATNSNFCGSAG